MFNAYTRLKCYNNTIAPSLSMTTHGFPPGYFVIKSVACDRVLDINGDEIEDGTEVILWVETEKSLVESKDCFL